MNGSKLPAWAFLSTIAVGLLGCGNSQKQDESSISQVSQALGFESLRRVSVSSAGAEAHGLSSTFTGLNSISADGRTVVFHSSAPDLIPGNQNTADQIYAKRVDTGELILVSQGTDGLPANLPSRTESISADGNVVAFVSTAANLVLGPRNAEDVFVRDLGTNVTSMVSVDLPPSTDGISNYLPALSGNGNVVAFVSQTQGQEAVYVRDRAAGVTELVAPVTQPGYGSLTISTDGRFVGYLATVAGSSSLIVRDRTFHTSTTLFHGAIRNMVMSGDAGWFAFESLSDAPPDDTNGKIDIGLLDRSSRSVVIISKPPGGGQANAGSKEPAISADGRFVSFESDASNLLPNTPFGGFYLYSRDASALERLEDRSASSSALSADGRYVVFSSPDPVPRNSNADTNQTWDVYWADRGASRLTGTIAGSVRDVNGRGIEGVTLTVAGTTATTNAAGAFAFPSVAAGTYVVNAAKTGYSFGSASVAAAWRTVTVPPGNASLVITGYKELPVVLVHGWNEGSGEFGNLPDNLRASGYHTSFADPVTNKDSTPSMEENALVLSQAVDQALDVTGQSKVIIVAHSMGGLVSRAYMEATTMPDGVTPKPDNVAALFSLGTPHLGVPSSTLGALANDQCAKGHSPGVCQMTEPGNSVFNRTYAQRASIDYHAIGGDPPIFTSKRACKRTFLGKFCISYPVFSDKYRNETGRNMGLLLQATDHLAHLGGEDGFIARPSSLGVHPLSPKVDRFTTKEVHDLELGHVAYFEQDDGNVAPQSYGLCLEPVLAHRAASCGTRAQLSDVIPGWKPPTTSAGASGAGAGSAAPPPPPAPAQAEPLPKEASSIAAGTILPGQLLKRTIPVEGGRTVFAAHWDTGHVDVTLIDPTGKTIDPAVIADQFVDPSDPDIDPTITTFPPEAAFYDSDATSASYDFPNPVRGQWQIVLRAQTDLPAQGTSYQSFAAYDSPLHVEIATDRSFYTPGSIARITATFSVAPEAASVTGEVLRSDGVATTIALTPQGGGVYAASYTVPSVSGYARIKVKASGTYSGGKLFERGSSMLVQFTTTAVSLNGSYTDQAEPRPLAPSLKQALLVRVGLASSINGTVGLAGDLVDASGNLVAHANASRALVPGATTLTLRFTADQIFAAHRNGPYTLTHLLLTDQRTAPIVAADVDNAYLTAAYDYRIFADAVDAPVLLVDGPFAVAEGSSITLNATGIDPEGDVLRIEWDLDNDGTFETLGASPIFSAGNVDGPALLTVRARATDPAGHSVQQTTTVDITNVAPMFSLGGDARLNVGDALARTITFNDPGPDSWNASVDFGDASPPLQLGINGKTFGLNHRYTRAGVFIAKVVLADDEGASAEASIAVTVVVPAPAWQSGRAYRIGDKVTYGGVTYACRQAHTSQVGWEPPNVPALWEIPTPPSGSAWIANTVYPVGILVTYSGSTYEARQAHTSQVGWEPPNVPALWNKR